MSEDELKKWFDDLAPTVVRDGTVDVGETTHPGTGAANRFLADADSAIRAAFATDHPICKQWHSIFLQFNGLGRVTHRERYELFHRLVAIFDSAHAQLKAGRRGSFTSIVRAAAEEDLLGIATELLDGGYRAAAAVTAGGAVEVHLRGLCERRGIKWVGKNQIENYKGALEQAEKAAMGAGITTTDGKLVTAWGGLRNDAAHDPVKFSAARSADDVKAMITGIREFIARTT